MIQPQELRIGNYVNVPRADQSPFRIDAFEYLYKEKCKVAQIDDPTRHPLTWYEGDLEPIELTEEWLVKLGIEKDDVGYKIENDNFIFKLLFYDCWNIMYNEKEGYGSSECLIRAFPYVHELQNIFFTLSGQELTIKE